MLKRKIDIYRAETQLIFILENYEWDADIKDYENERSNCRDFNPWNAYILIAISPMKINSRKLQLIRENPYGCYAYWHMAIKY